MGFGRYLKKKQEQTPKEIESWKDKWKNWFGKKAQENTETINPAKPVWNKGITFFTMLKGSLALFFIIMISWKNFWHLGYLPKPAKVFYNPMITLKMAETWNMFGGGNDYFQFWPQVKATTNEGVVFDAWKDYIGA